MSRSSAPSFICELCYASRAALRPQRKLALALSRSYTRPTFAPKPSPDIKHIARNPGLYEQNCKDRDYEARSKDPWRILQLVEERAQAQKDTVTLRQQNNNLQSQMKALASQGQDNEQERQQLLEQAKQLKEQLNAINTHDSQRNEELEALALSQPNLSSAETPNGSTHHLISLHTRQSSDTNPLCRSHADIGTRLGLLDFAGAAKTTGWGWYFLDGALADLEDALVQYALSIARSHGWNRTAPPSLVYRHIAEACGFQPRDQHNEQQIYTLEHPAQQSYTHALAATAEIPLAARMADTLLDEAQLPLKSVGVSRCYRAEAGARGADTRGLYRVHEFTKVELFAWTMPTHDENGPHFVTSPSSSPGTEAPPARPSQSSYDAVFNDMLAIQIAILRGLDLTFRVMEMPATDLGASASRKIDIEVLFPSRSESEAGAGAVTGSSEEAASGWGEVTSASQCTDYQARRLGTRVRRAADGSRGWAYSANGTAMAVPRVLAALLEYGWNEQHGVVRIPDVLRKWMGGKEVLDA